MDSTKLAACLVAALALAACGKSPTPLADGGADRGPDGAAGQDDGGAGSFKSFRLSKAYGPCPPGGDCIAYIDLAGDGTISADLFERPDASEMTATLAPSELTHAISVLTAPALVTLLDAAQPPCLPPTDIFESMRLVDDAGSHENSTTGCLDAPLKAARDMLNTLAQKYFLQPTR
jgi:hypothetical protein